MPTARASPPCTTWSPSPTRTPRRQWGSSSRPSWYVHHAPWRSSLQRLLHQDNPPPISTVCVVHPPASISLPAAAHPAHLLGYHDPGDQERDPTDALHHHRGHRHPRRHQPVGRHLLRRRRTRSASQHHKQKLEQDTPRIHRKMTVPPVLTCPLFQYPAPSPLQLPRQAHRDQATSAARLPPRVNEAPLPHLLHPPRSRRLPARPLCRRVLHQAPLPPMRPASRLGLGWRW